jgi:hypothetical protein
MYILKNVYAYIRMHIDLHMHTNMYIIHMCECMYGIHTYISIYIRVHLCQHICISAYIHIYIHVYCTYTNIFTSKYMHLCIYIQA